MTNSTPIPDNYFNNSTTLPHPKPFIIPKYVMYQVYALNGIFVLMGIVGNTLVCFIVTRGKKMATVANLFLVNLAVADLFILIISYPLWILQALLPHAWPFGSSLCKILFPLSDCFYGVSLGCMMAISVHRYLKIIHSKGKQMKSRHAKCIVIFFYLISILTISVPGYPIMQYSETVTFLNETIGSGHHAQKAIVKKICYWDYPSETYRRTLMLYFAIAWYLIPLLLIMLTFLRIKYYLQHKMGYHWVKQSSHNLLLKSRVDGIRKALRLLAPVVIAFAVLMLPWNILRVISVFKRLNYGYLHNQIFNLIAATMLVINSVVNPFIYYITSNDFRLEFKYQFKILLMILKLSKGTVSPPDVSRSGGDNSFKCSLNSAQYNNFDRSISESFGSVRDSTTNYPNFDEIFDKYKNRDNAITEEVNGGESVCSEPRSESTNQSQDENNNDVTWGLVGKEAECDVSAFEDDVLTDEMDFDLNMIHEIRERLKSSDYKETEL